MLSKGGNMPKIDESSVSLKQKSMKERNQNTLFWSLLICLLLSVLLNWIQTNYIQHLDQEIEDMEYLQSVLTSHVHELEQKGADDETY